MKTFGQFLIENNLIKIDEIAHTLVVLHDLLEEQPESEITQKIVYGLNRDIEKLKNYIFYNNPDYIPDPLFADSGRKTEGTKIFRKISQIIKQRTGFDDNKWYNLMWKIRRVYHADEIESLMDLAINYRP